jgi:hypothetical protein
MPKLIIDTEDLDVDVADEDFSQKVDGLETQTLAALRDAVDAALGDRDDADEYEAGDGEDAEEVDPSPFYVDGLDPLKLDAVPTYTAFDLQRVATAALVSIACDQTVCVQLRLKAAGYIAENRDNLASKGSN